MKETEILLGKLKDLEEKEILTRKSPNIERITLNKTLLRNIAKEGLLVNLLYNHETGRINNPTIATIKSKNSKNTWEIKTNEQHGFSCNCPSWIYNQRGNRTCKHTDELQKLLQEA